MNKKILIIRSAGFQQLDSNINKISTLFPNHEIWILTHEHGKAVAKRYEKISKVCVYPYSDSFDVKRKVPKLSKISFDAVIIPVTNITGAGFINVFRFGLTFNASKIYMCNMVSEIKRVSKLKIIAESYINKIFDIVSHIAACALFCAAVPLLFAKRILR